MIDIKIDSNTIEKSGVDFLKLVAEYNQLYNDMFNKIVSINKEGNIWKGSAANAFVERVMNQKTDFIKIEESLKKYGEILVIASENYEAAIKKSDIGGLS